MQTEPPGTPSDEATPASVPEVSSGNELIPRAETATLQPLPNRLPAIRPVQEWAARQGWRVATFVVLASLAALGVVRVWFGPTVPVESVIQRDFVQTVVASGRIESPHRVEIGAQITGSVVKVPVEEGQTVAAGTALVLLDDGELRAAASQAQLTVEQALARVRQLREVDEPAAEQALRQAQANYTTATHTLERNRKLYEQSFIGNAALEESVRAEQVARALLRIARQQWAGSRPGGSSAMNAQAALDAARAAADVARVRLSYAVLRAPVAGTLIARDVEPGHVVQPGKTLMVLSPSGDTQVVLQVDEKNMRLLKLGQPALGSADAYPDQRFPAQVAYINPGVDALRGAVQVKLAVPEPPVYLRQDMTVSVDIEVARRPAAVLVPADAVHELDSAAPWVLKVERGRARRQALELGLRSSGWCEVLRGVVPGDQVVRVAGETSKIADGARLRPRPPGE